MNAQAIRRPISPALALAAQPTLAPTLIRVIAASALATLLLGAIASLHAQAPYQDTSYANSPQALDDAQQLGQLVDPPSRVARLSVLQGNVSFQPATVSDFSAAELNYPLTSGDRIYVDSNSTAELEAGQLTLRLGRNADSTVTSLTDDVAQFGLAQGSAHLRAFALDPNTTTELDTPNASVTLLAPGDYRVDVFPDGNVTIVTVFSGQVTIAADGVQQTLSAGQSLEIRGTNPSQAQLIRRARPDALDQFSAQRDALYQQQLAQNGQYVNPGTIGYADLGQYGDWDANAGQGYDGADPGDNGGDYGGGPVWFPRNVAVDWQPYSVGHWAYIRPWGWTWVEAEPWGFAPFHYGRWARFGPRWGWIPGPRVIRPVYSPALVVFVGGPNFRIGIGGRSPGGPGLAAWFPLGPREVYQPPYRTGPGYINRINVTNIYNRNPVEVRNVYNNRTVNIYANGGPGRQVGPGGQGGGPDRGVRGGQQNNNGGPGFQPHYVNRGIATIAVPQDKFAGGRPVVGNAIHVDPAQAANAPIATRPPFTPGRFGGNGANGQAPNAGTNANPNPGAQPPRAVPPSQARPVFANQGGGNDHNRNFGGAGAPSAPVAGNQPPAGQNPGGRNPGNRNGGGQAPAGQAPVAQAPAAQAPVNQAPGAQMPVHQQPGRQAQTPVTQTPSTQTPVNRYPTTQQPPVTPAPVTSAPVNQNPPRNGYNGAPPNQPRQPQPTQQPTPTANPQPEEGPRAPRFPTTRQGPVDAPRYQPQQQQPAPVAPPAPAPEPKAPTFPTRQNGPVEAPRYQTAPPAPAPAPAQPQPPVNHEPARDPARQPDHQPDRQPEHHQFQPPPQQQQAQPAPQHPAPAPAPAAQKVVDPKKPQ